MLPSEPITSVTGIGEKKAGLYKKLGIETVYDLLHHFPRSYTDYRNATTISGAAIGSIATICARVIEKSPPILIRGGRKIYRLLAQDEDSNVLIVSFFNNKYAFEALKLSEEYIFQGKLSGNFSMPEMTSPTFILKSACTDMQPNYPLTAGLSHKMIASNIKSALNSLSRFPATCLPDFILEKENLSNNFSAFSDIHFPKDLYQVDDAKKLFILEELLCLQLGMSGLKRRKKKKSRFILEKTDYSEFSASLPFKLTNGQIEAISAAISDMKSQNSMNRLLQGDVGSGKTVVAAALFYLVCLSGAQGAIMAPTEILAIQHFNTLTKQLSPFGIRVEKLTSSLTAKQKREVTERLKKGEIDVVCGTHALIENNVEFKNLALVVTDEQHRFGVSQRAALISKGYYPHTLVMSATPIPRSLALTIYGDLDISILNELPSGRKPVKTYLINQNIRARAFSFIEKEVALGHQAYIVCPAVEESELEIESAIEYSEKLAKALKNCKIGLLHGKMKGNEKDEIMSKFKNGEIDVLVSTTVIEVGVDVSNASIMMIENADRFGLSQLHQLRGRVGRGDIQSHCILVSNSKSKTATERLSVMKNTYDGFEIAKHDLKQRGPGDFFGTRQHGLPPLRTADLLSDSRLLEKAQKYAAEILERDPTLSLEENLPLKEKVNSMFRKLNFATSN